MAAASIEAARALALARKQRLLGSLRAARHCGEIEPERVAKPADGADPEVLRGARLEPSDGDAARTATRRQRRLAHAARTAGAAQLGVEGVVSHRTYCI